MFRLVVDVRIVQHSLRGNAPDVQASSSERTSFLDARRLHNKGTTLEDMQRESGLLTLRPSWAALIAATYPPGPTDTRSVLAPAPKQKRLDKQTHLHQLQQHRMAPTGWR